MKRIDSTCTEYTDLINRLFYRLQIKIDYKLRLSINFVILRSTLSILTIRIGPEFENESGGIRVTQSGGIM